MVRISYLMWCVSDFVFFGTNFFCRCMEEIVAKKPLVGAARRLVEKKKRAQLEQERKKEPDQDSEKQPENNSTKN